MLRLKENYKIAVPENTTIIFNLYCHYISEFMKHINAKIHTFDTNKQTFIIM